MPAQGMDPGAKVPGEVRHFGSRDQEQESLVLLCVIIPVEVDDERAHAQASPTKGYERRVSFSPASSRPSLRYFT